MQDKSTSTVCIIDYGMGNLRSVYNKVAQMTDQVILSADPEDLFRADKLILPGVGHFKQGMDNLKSRGLYEALLERVLLHKTPILGICLGMQLFSRYSEEGDCEGLGWIDAITMRIDSAAMEQTKVKVPHMGWNTLEIKEPHNYYEGISPEEELYFCHSYHVFCADEADVVSRTHYGIDMVASVEKDNIHGMQFHPEKSHDSGALLIKNFVGEAQTVSV